MNNHHGKSSANQGFSDRNPEKEPKKSFNSDKSKNYATDMWHKIEGSVSKDKRNELKGAVNQQPKEGGHKHHRRHNRHRGNRPDREQSDENRSFSKEKGQKESLTKFEDKNFHEKVEGQDNDKKLLLKKEPGKVEPIEPKSQFKKESTVESQSPGTSVEAQSPFDEASSAAPRSPFDEESSVAPRSPFDEEPSTALGSPFDEASFAAPKSPFEDQASVSPFEPSSKASALPTQDHEERYKEEVQKKDDFLKKSQNAEDEAVSETEIVEDGEPIDPFAVAPQPKPLENRALDERALDDLRKVDKPEAAFYDEEKSAEEIGEAEEAQTPALEGVVTEPTVESDDFSFKPKEKIQEKVKSEPHKVIEAKAEVDKSEVMKSPDSEIEGFKEDFWTVMEQAGITKRKACVIIAVFVSLVIGVLVYFLGWYKYVIFWDKNGQMGPVVEKIDDEEDVSVGKNEREVQPYDIISSYIFGLEYSEAVGPIIAEPISKFGISAGFEAAFIFGENVDLKEERYVEYVELLIKVRNIYELDIYALLDQAVDRRAALNDYLQQLQNLIGQSTVSLEVLKQSLVDLDSRYEFIGTQSDQYEADFFVFIDGNLGRAAYDTLQLFIESTQEAAQIKANFSAEKILRDRFVKSLNLLRPRYKDVSVNEEALIKGIKVFDVSGSDIESIIPLEE